MLPAAYDIPDYALELARFGMSIALIVAMTPKRVIGRAGGLPWHLPSELKFFKRTTLGKPVIMGRKTYQSIGKPLPGRSNLIVSRNPHLHVPGCTVHDSLDAALKAAKALPADLVRDDEIMLIGGAQLYAQALEQADRLYLTIIDAELTGDAYFPEIKQADWRELWRDYLPADARHAYGYSRLLLEHQ